MDARTPADQDEKSRSATNFLARTNKSLDLPSIITTIL